MDLDPVDVVEVVDVEDLKRMDLYSKFGVLALNNLFLRLIL